MSKAGNPRDSMKSTWRLQEDKSNWGIAHKMFHSLGPDLNRKPPVHQKTDPIPILSTWSCNFWVFAHALWPMALHRVFVWATGLAFHPVAAILFYGIAFQANAIRATKIFRELGYRYGYLDGDKHERDQIPDVAVNKVFYSLERAAGVRPLLAVFISYRRNETIGLSWWLPLELFFYSVVLDLFFYTYHRCAHEVPQLWKFHRTHHLTKHPNSLLSSYSDEEQEIIEAAIIPVLTWASLRLMGFPMSFYDWWICHEYIVFAELLGHSGLRLSGVPPGISNVLLGYIGYELAIEDHDIHHRKGWRKAHNYGKQTRLWDRIFGTCGERFETLPSNTDHSTIVKMPLRLNR